MSQARVKPGLPQLDRPPGGHCCHLPPWLHCHHPFGDFGQLSSWSPPPALARGPTFVSLSVRSVKCGLDPAACFCLSGTEVKDRGLRLGYERFHSPREAGHHPGSSSIGCPGPALCRVAPGQGNPGGGQPDLDSVSCSIWPWAGVLTMTSQGLRWPCQLGRGGVGAAKLQRHLGPGGSREVRVLVSGWRLGSRWNPPAE